MGYFSWKCAKSGKSIPAYPNAKRDIRESTVFLILPDNTRVSGVYDGFGCINHGIQSVDIYDALAPFVIGPGATSNDVTNYSVFQKYIKIVRADMYSGEKFDELPISERCDRQGFFY